MFRYGEGAGIGKWMWEMAFLRLFCYEVIFYGNDPGK